MSREIKFRAWNPDENKMYNRFALDADGFALTWNPSIGAWIEERNTKYWSVMQFTGLRDKNGKEIYEGDVVKTYDFDGREELQRVGWSTQYEEQNLTEWLMDLGYARGEMGSYLTFEVVGNVYENPELIESR